MAYTPTDNPYIPGDPYSYDLKWIVAKIKEALTSIEGLTTGQSDLSNDFEELKEYVYNYFDNLDISQEVEDKIDELYAAGFFDDIIEEWMNGHIKWTNPNLLDNPWFTVNQRGVTSGSGTGVFAPNVYRMDRWTTTYSSSQSLGSWNLTDGILSINSGTGNRGIFQQKFANPDWFNGKVLTASIMLADYTILSGTITRTNGVSQRFIGTQGVYVDFSDQNQFQFSPSTSGSIDVRAVKLELGPYSTLANDAPPDYREELAKCQYYAVNLNNPIGVLTRTLSAPTTVQAYIPLPVRMRGVGESATITSVSLGSIIVEGALVTPSSIASNNIKSNGILIALTVPTGLTARSLGNWDGFNLFISKDL